MANKYRGYTAEQWAQAFADMVDTKSGAHELREATGSPDDRGSSSVPGLQG